MFRVAILLIQYDVGVGLAWGRCALQVLGREVKEQWEEMSQLCVLRENEWKENRIFRQTVQNKGPEPLHYNEGGMARDPLERVVGEDSQGGRGWKLGTLTTLQRLFGGGSAIAELK